MIGATVGMSLMKQMRRGMLLRKIGFALVVVLFNQSAYGQESLPETVERFDRDVQRISEELNALSRAVEEIRLNATTGAAGATASGSPVYFGPLENQSSCEILTATLNYIDTSYPLQNLVAIENVKDRVPFEIEITGKCSYLDEPFDCNLVNAFDFGKGKTHIATLMTVRIIGTCNLKLLIF